MNLGEFSIECKNNDEYVEVQHMLFSIGYGWLSDDSTLRNISSKHPPIYIYNYDIYDKVHMKFYSSFIDRSGIIKNSYNYNTFKNLFRREKLEKIEKLYV